MTHIKFEIPPRPKGRPRFANGHAYTPKLTLSRSTLFLPVLEQLSPLMVSCRTFAPLPKALRSISVLVTPLRCRRLSFAAQSIWALLRALCAQCWSWISPTRLPLDLISCPAPAMYMRRSRPLSISMSNVIMCSPILRITL